MSSLSPSPLATLRGHFTERHAARLLWRAGFGPRPGQAAALARLGLDGAVASLTRPRGAAKLIGAAPHDDKGAPLDPVNTWGQDHTWWLDRMVRSNHSLTERMTLVWHSWFATSVDSSTQGLMLAQNRMMRSHALGNFHSLLLGVTSDPAMLMWLNGNQNTRQSPNENYGRELMELFTLGADRGAYSQRDVHQQARALTGFTNDWSDRAGPHNFHFDADRHDPGVKTIFGHRGRFTWQDSCRLCVTHPLHASFMVRKLWGYFIADAPSAGEVRALTRTYVRSGFEVRPLMEAILRHPKLYDGGRLVTPPAVYVAGLLRGLRRTITTDDWSWICDQAGQKLFEPPNVAGWNYASWLDTSRWAARFTAVTYAMRGITLDPEKDAKHYPPKETPEQAVASALRYWHNPPLSKQTVAGLTEFSSRAQGKITADWEQTTYRVLRQNALRALIPTTPEWQAV